MICFWKGEHKPEIQKLCEELEECGRFLLKYKQCFGIIGKTIAVISRQSRKQDGYTQMVEVYGCADCSGSGRKSRCLYNIMLKNPDQNEVMKINERREELREESYANIQSAERIQKRQIRSIQTKGHSGRSKKMKTFGTLITGQRKKCIKKIMLNAIGRYTVNHKYQRIF